MNDYYYEMASLTYLIGYSIYSFSDINVMTSIDHAITAELLLLVLFILCLFSPLRRIRVDIWDCSMLGLSLMPIAVLRYFDLWINILIVAMAWIIWLSTCGYIVIKDRNKLH